jgi:hypothetical protein
MTSGASWTVTKDVASWTFALDPADPAILRDPAARAGWLAERVDRLVKAMPPFALPGRIDVSTDSGGDPALTIDDPERLPDLHPFVRGQHDVWVVNLDLVLQVELFDDRGWYPASFTGGHATIHIEAENGIIDEARIETGDAVWLVITLDTELYAPRTYAAVTDNRPLAERNGARLSEFLQRMESDLPARFLYVESQSYRDQTHQHGFRSTPG